MMVVVKLLVEQGERKNSQGNERKRETRKINQEYEGKR